MTELIRDGKYDAKGRKTAPLRVTLLFQTVETVNESVQERQRSLDLLLLGRGQRRVAQPLGIGRQEVGPARAAGRVRRASRSDLHRPSVLHWDDFTLQIALDGRSS
jgi:hypothetical protein